MFVEAALKKFATSVRAKMMQPTAGDPEDQLRGPFENFMAEAGTAIGLNALVCTGNTRLPGHLGIPDYAVHLRQSLVGYAELKAPGVGAAAARFRGHNREQFVRFSAIPNIMYSDGNEWALYRSGQLFADKVVRVSGDISVDGVRAITAADAHAVEKLLREFLSWYPIIPTDQKGNVDLREFAVMLAPLCRMLRDEVADALEDRKSPLVRLAQDWRQLLFPSASDQQFADAYAQTVTFALLLARSEGADPLELDSAISALAADHTLLSRALQVLTDSAVRGEIGASLDLLLRVIGAVAPRTFAGPHNPWLYFYEDFLAVYDPQLRKNSGVYYTPVQVVKAQVRLIDDVLVNRFGKPLGFAEPEVVILDPAAGTGTYLLGVIEHVLGRIKETYGSGAVAGHASRLAGNLYGFEIMAGPYAVCELRVSRALHDQGAALPSGGTHIYLTDTLESPHTEPPQLPLFLRPIADQHARALRVKSTVPVIVCLGNPPYDRHQAADTRNKATTGGWVRWGDKGDASDAILSDFLGPAIAAGHGRDLKNLYNLYIYFWRWALWKVFEHKTARGPGIVSFISASSYLDGDAFVGVREHMRRLCDEIWIIDLGGEGRGTRKTENVFDIQTPVAIALAMRAGDAREKTPAKVHYARLEGTRAEKLTALDEITNFGSLTWRRCPDDWQAPFRPAGTGDYFTWPLLTDVMPWQESGVKAGRTWVIAPDPTTLRSRWRALLHGQGDKRKELFKDSPTGRKVDRPAVQLPPSAARLKPLSDLATEGQSPEIVSYAFRSLDRQWVFADARLLDRPNPELWGAHGQRQVYLTTLLNHPLGRGPAATACALIPDLHHFRGSYGAKEVFPLYRRSDGSEPNISAGVLGLLQKAYRRTVQAEEVLAYVYGVLAQPVFTSLYSKELETRELRVPFTKDAKLFENARNIGVHLLWLHTYGHRFAIESGHLGVLQGRARCTRAVPQDPNGYPESFEYGARRETLRVGAGEFAPVPPEVFEFEVSGLKVVQSWLKYRMKGGAGKRSSALDEIRPERWTSEFTTELLELIWALEATLAAYPEQSKILQAIAAGECFHATELPAVPDFAREPPKAATRQQKFFVESNGR